MKKYQHLTLLEREQLFVWYEVKVSIREIGRRLKRDPGTITRELKRNRSGVAKDILRVRLEPNREALSSVLQ